MGLRDEAAIVICWEDVPRVKLPLEMNPGDSGKMDPVKMDLTFWQSKTSFKFTAVYSTPPSWAFTFMDWVRGRDNGRIIKENK